jgi:hypothetical protein
VLLQARLARGERRGADFDEDLAWTVAIWPVEG